MESDKEKRNRAEDLLNEFKQESSKIEGLDPSIHHYLDMRFNKIEELLEKILKRIDWATVNTVLHKPLEDYKGRLHRRFFCFSSTSVMLHESKELFIFSNFKLVIDK